MWGFLYTCEIKSPLGVVESAATRDTQVGCVKWFRDQGIDFKNVTMERDNDIVAFTFQRKESNDV